MKYYFNFLFVILCGVVLILVGVMCERRPQAPKVDKPVEIKKEYPKSTWKPKSPPKSLNIQKWAGQGFALTAKNECGKCKKASWITKGDPGGLTTIGVTLRDNPELYIRVLTREWEYCRQGGIFMPDEKHPFGRVKDLCYELRKHYWDKYAKPYKNCDYNALLWLTDTSILSGPRSSALILQRASFIRPDGLWGPQTEAQCQTESWVKNKKKFIVERRQYLAGLKKLKRFHKGWDKRINRMIKEGF